MQEIIIQIFSDLLPPANEVCEGYAFTRVCQSFCSRGGGVPGVPGGGICSQGGAWSWGGGLLPVGCLVPGGAYSWGVSARGGGTSAPRWGCLVPGGVCSGGLLLRAVRILLECILDNCHSFEDILSYCEESHFFTIQSFYLSLQNLGRSSDLQGRRLLDHRWIHPLASASLEMSYLVARRESPWWQLLYELM